VQHLQQVIIAAQAIPKDTPRVEVSGVRSSSGGAGALVMSVQNKVSPAMRWMAKEGRAAAIRFGTGAAMGARVTAPAAGIVALADSPAPGPGDLAALTIIAIGTTVGGVWAVASGDNGNSADAALTGDGPDTAATPPGGPDDDGPNSKYDRTTKGRSVENRHTNVARQEFEQNLRENGWRESKSADGKVTIFEKDGAKYVLRDNAKSTGGPSADFYKSGSKSVDVKIRLGGT
jgi:hypothetical protein